MTDSGATVQLLIGLVVMAVELSGAVVCLAHRRLSGWTWAMALGFLAGFGASGLGRLGIVLVERDLLRVEAITAFFAIASIAHAGGAALIVLGLAMTLADASRRLATLHHRIEGQAAGTPGER